MFLCCGEALIDMLPRETREGAACFEPHAGGSIFNTAIALGRLGTPVRFFTGLSTDFFGQMLREELSASRVDLTHVVESDRPTTLAFVKLENGHARYAFFDENTSGRMLSEADLPELPSAVTGLFFGSISLVSEPGADTYLSLLEREAAQRLIMVDPNIRQGFIKDEARYRARLARAFGKADLVKLSDEDLHWLEGEGDLSDLARRVLALGPKVVFVTEGGNGARAVFAGGERRVASQKVTVADTVGAGDTFSAGIMTALYRAGAASKAAVAEITPELIEAALELGAKAAAVTVSRPGANPPWDHEL